MQDIKKKFKKLNNTIRGKEGQLWGAGRNEERKIGWMQR